MYMYIELMSGVVNRDVDPADVVNNVTAYIIFKMVNMSLNLNLASHRCFC